MGVEFGGREEDGYVEGQGGVVGAGAVAPRERKHFKRIGQCHDFTDERRATRARARRAVGDPVGVAHAFDLGEEGIWPSNCRFTWTIMRLRRLIRVWSKRCCRTSPRSSATPRAATILSAGRAKRPWKPRASESLR